MQQYKRTRSAATREGAKHAKEIVKQQVIAHIHPLLISSLDDMHCIPYSTSNTTSNTTSAANDTVAKIEGNWEEIERKNEFIRLLQQFRPQQTVFESGIGSVITSQGAGKENPGHGSRHESCEKIKLFKKLSQTMLLRHHNNHNNNHNNTNIDQHVTHLDSQHHRSTQHRDNNHHNNSDDDHSDNESDCDDNNNNHYNNHNNDQDDQGSDGGSGSQEEEVQGSVRGSGRGGLPEIYLT
jgi:hypothetical protein